MMDFAANSSIRSVVTDFHLVTDYDAHNRYFANVYAVHELAIWQEMACNQRHKRSFEKRERKELRDMDM